MAVVLAVCASLALHTPSHFGQRTPSSKLPLSVPPRLPSAPHAAAVVAPRVLQEPVACASDTPKEPGPLVLDGVTKLQLAILLSTGLLIQMGVGMIIVVLPIFAQSLNLGAAGVGLLVALPQVTKLLFNLPVGYLCDVIGRKPPLIAGALVDALGACLTGTATGLTQLVPARLLVGIGSATGWTATTTYTMDVVGKYPQHSGLLFGIVQAVGFLAFALGPALGGALSERYSPSLPFRLISLILLVTTPLKLLLPETLKGRPAGGGDAVGLGGLKLALNDSLDSSRRLLADRSQQALLAMKASFLVGLSLILTVVPLHATAVWGATAADLGRLQSFVTLLALVASPVAGVLADRFGKAPLAICGSLCTALSVACLPLVKGRGAYYLVRSLWSAGEALLITAYTALALEVQRPDAAQTRSSLWARKIGGPHCSVARVLRIRRASVSAPTTGDTRGAARCQGEPRQPSRRRGAPLSAAYLRSGRVLLAARRALDGLGHDGGCQLNLLAPPKEDAGTGGYRRGGTHRVRDHARGAVAWCQGVLGKSKCIGDWKIYDFRATSIGISFVVFEHHSKQTDVHANGP